MAFMSTQTAPQARPTGPVPSIPGQGPATRPNLVAVGTMVWLSSELMFFAALFAFYFTIRGHEPGLWEDHTVRLNVPFALANTIVLVVSSVWCQLGVLQAEKGIVARPAGTSLAKVSAWGMREWYVPHLHLRRHLHRRPGLRVRHAGHRGREPVPDAYGSVFYLATGFHGMHVTGGLIAFLLIIGRTFTTRHYSHAQATGAVVTSYYWHFVDVVWIALFIMIYVLK